MDSQPNGAHAKPTKPEAEPAAPKAEPAARVTGFAAPHDQAWKTAPHDAGAPHDKGWVIAPHAGAAPHDSDWTRPRLERPAPSDGARWTVPKERGAAPHEKRWLPQSGLKPRLSRGPAIAIAALFCVIFIGVGMFYAGIQETQSGLRGAVWSKTDGDGVTLTLDFKDGVIDYDASTYLLWLGDYSVDIADIDYRVVAPGTIQARIDSWDGWRTLSVDVQGDVLTITPALTDGSSMEIWIHDYSAYLS